MRERLIIPALALGFLVLYLATLTSVHTYDALSYILDVDRKPWQELFHPHHLAYGPLGATIKALAVAVGWQGSSERLLQVANAVAGAVGVGLFGLLVAWTARLRRVPGSAWQPGALAALLLGASYAYWYYAVEVEVYTIAATLLIAALWLMLALLRRPSLGLAVALGLVQGGAVLFHQTNVLLSGPALLVLGLVLRRGFGRPWLLLLAYGLPLALVVGIAYLGVGLGISGFRSWEELFRWAAGYTTTGFWGGAVDSSKLVSLGRGLSATVAQPGGALLGFVLLGVLLVCARGLVAAPRGLVVICISWLAIYGAFFLWWEPDNIEFWIASLPPLYLLVTLAAHGSQNQRRQLAMGTLLACVFLMLGLNTATIRAQGDADRDRQRLVAGLLAAGSAPGDLIIAPDSVVELYLPFYEDRVNVTSLSQTMTATNGAWPAACALLRAKIGTALASGYAVRIADEARRPPLAPPGEPPTPAERYGLTPDEVAACFERLARATTIVTALPLPGYWLLPSTQSLADGPGWDFRRSRWGWQALNATPTESPLAGWALIPGVDPALISPPFQIDAAQVAVIEVRLATTTAARDAQLFFLDTQGRTDEARSVRFTLEPGSEMQTYRLMMQDVPGWEGLVTGLRFDPVGLGDGGIVVIEGLRLLSE
ncbi:MAG: hypothetical protein AB4911_01390 [Oscillochloridaceae bacterium umkhey_bin13]